MVKKIKVSFTAQDLSNTSGIYLVLLFLQKIGLVRMLKKYIQAWEYFK